MLYFYRVSSSCLPWCRHILPSPGPFYFARGGSTVSAANLRVHFSKEEIWNTRHNIRKSIHFCSFLRSSCCYFFSSFSAPFNFSVLLEIFVYEACLWVSTMPLKKNATYSYGLGFCKGPSVSRRFTTWASMNATTTGWIFSQTTKSCGVDGMSNS